MFFKKGERIAAHLSVLALTKLFVILSAKRERIRNPHFKRTDCHSRLRSFAMTKVEERIAAVALRLACRLGRCFCFAEVSTGHPHLRNDKSYVFLSA